MLDLGVLDSSCLGDSVETQRVYLIFIHQNMGKNSRGILGPFIIDINYIDEINTTQTLDWTDCC